jgi:hypothetical protein
MAATGMYGAEDGVTATIGAGRSTVIRLLEELATVSQLHLSLLR